MKLRISIPLSLILLLLLVPFVSAHGAESDVVIDGTNISVFARFDTGEPMENAQIAIYAPDSPQEVWQSGISDAEGFFQFDIDNSLAGQWSVSVRTAGHGEILYLDVSTAGVVSAETGTDSTLRTVLAVAVVTILGAVAWYFMRSNNKIGSTEQKDYARA